MKFQVDTFCVERVSKHGAWLVTCDSAVDLGLLFLRPQEFYESANPDFCGKLFTFEEYIRWYISHTKEDNKPCAHTFSYFDDFVGFNIPGDVVINYLGLAHPSLSAWDMRFARIAAVVQHHQHGPFYIIGSTSARLSVIEHELAHAMFYLLPEYKRAAELLVQALPEDARAGLTAVLRTHGYSDAVMVDETQAYMATGLIEEMENFEPLRMPFMKLFARWKRKFIPPKRTKKIKAPA